MSPEKIIEQLALIRHPEGGYFRETYRAAEIIRSGCLPEQFNGDRNFSTTIYYLLQAGDFSAFHRIKSDEGWHFYAGQSLLVHVIFENGKYECMRLGNKLDHGENFQAMVPAGSWFASETAPGTSFSLAGCTVSPGFDFADFDMADKHTLIQLYPQHENIISRLCR